MPRWSKYVTVNDIIGSNVSAEDLTFLWQYAMDNDARRAATAAGLDPDDGYKLVNKHRATIKLMSKNMLESQMNALEITPEWLLMELVDNHRLARQSNKLSASNTALGLIAKHQMVDAMSAEKIISITDQDVVDRLVRGRARAKGMAPADPPEEAPSFL